MSEFASEKDRLIAKIGEIEKTENIADLQKSKELILKHASLTSLKDKLEQKLGEVKAKLDEIFDEQEALSINANEKLFEALKNQRWYFIEGNKNIIFDSKTGYLWANPENFPCLDISEELPTFYLWEDAEQAIVDFEADGIEGWDLPTDKELVEMIKDNTFPFQQGHDHNILEQCNWFCTPDGYNIEVMDLDVFESSANFRLGCVIPVSRKLVEYIDYKHLISPENELLTERDRLQVTLDLLSNNLMVPLFNDPAITEQYRKVYIEKPQLIEQLIELESESETIITL